MAKVKGNPTVSVIIPTYNRAHFIGEAIQSVLSQTYQDFELIVVDDGSTDDTDEVVEGFNDGRLRYIKLEENSGKTATPRNTGLKAARGEYIAFLDSDDVCLPNRLEVEVEFLNTHPSVGLVYADVVFFGSRVISEGRVLEGVSPLSGYALKELFVNNPISSDAVLVRKTCFEKVGLYDESLAASEDGDMWLRIAACFEIDCIDFPLARYRRHEGNKNLDTERMFTGWIAVRRKCLESNPFLLDEIDSKTMQKCYYILYRAFGSWYLSSRVPRKAREQFREYLRLYPRDPLAYIAWLTTFLPPRLSSEMLTWWQKLIPYMITMKRSFTKRLFHT